MIQLVTKFDLHNQKHKIYVFDNQVVKNIIEPDDIENYVTEILNLYIMNNADKIVFSGNDLLMEYYSKKIIEQNKSQYNLTVNIEKISENGKEIQL